MFKNIAFLSVLLFSTFTSCGQIDKQDYQGEWVGHLPNRNSFNLQVSVERLTGDSYKVSIANDGILIDKDIESSREDGLLGDIGQQLFFDLEYRKNGEVLTGFIKSGRFYYHIMLPNVGGNRFLGMWNPLLFNNGLHSDDINLYVEEIENEELVAYPFLGDQRSRGFYAGNFKLEGDTLRFKDQNTGFNFRAKLLESAIELDIFLVDALITKADLEYTADGWEYQTDPIPQFQNIEIPESLNDGWVVEEIESFGINKSVLLQLIDSINAKKLINTHSILIAKENKLVFETYFDGFNPHIPHDTRSASKSISSAMVGIAMDDGVLKNVDQKLYDFIPETYQYTKDPLKAGITIKDLLTMSSGLDVNNLAYEDYYQQTDNWLKTVLEAPMVEKPGTYADYGSANPFLLGICLDKSLKRPLVTYMDEKLFAPLGITNYVNQADYSGTTPYFGGGMLLTSRDLLKFGQLYLSKGKWNGKQIIPESWVEESFQKHVRLQDREEKNEYGYLWWHDVYPINGEAISSIEARGAGGQFVFIVPELDTVCVITAGNYRNGKGNQSREIFAKYILPAIKN